MIKVDETCGFVKSGSRYCFHLEKIGNLEPPNLYEYLYSLHEYQYQELLVQQKIEPVKIYESSIGSWWMYKDFFYFENYNRNDEYFKITAHIKSKILELAKEHEQTELQKHTEEFDNFDETIDKRFLSGLSIEALKKIINAREEIFKRLNWNDIYNYKMEYENWVRNGGRSTFEISPIYEKWNTRVNNIQKGLENAKKILGLKLRGDTNFPTNFESDKTIKKVIKPGREPIPDKVKLYVWKRDEGKCVECSSNEKLEYDHIIPISKGGSNTERNIQLLCEICNRSKAGSLVRKTK